MEGSILTEYLEMVAKMQPNQVATAFDPPPLYRDRKPRFEEARVLVSIGRDCAGREASLAPEAAAAWQAMLAEATVSGITLLVVSAFRSVARQEEIVTGKLRRGLTWDQILAVSAYPGFSEHHTGTAIDIATQECTDLVEEFEATAAFHWLQQNANRFGFTLSYPRNNSAGIVYEPWHWRWHERQ